ncbi:MAG: M15 family metallopeptidase, partial [Clostridia bacterium]|nr:M15 family metallopeptidase [Clostridia bacterium]
KAQNTKSSGTTSSSAKKTTSSTTKKTTDKGEYMYAYAGFNPVTTDMNVPFNEILLNRKYKLPDGYVPTLAEAVKGSGVKLDYRVAPHYQEMYNAAKKDGITLTPVSGYRSYERQKNNFEGEIRSNQAKGMDKVTATQKAAEIRLLPGTSEHNAGLAMDICSLSTSFENTKEFKWLQAHAHEYGFIMRYPKNKTNVTKITYEPWHYRYVGKDIAYQLKSSGMVLEEYLGKSA